MGPGRLFNLGELKLSKTLVNIVNGVLARLREDSVTDFNDTTYSTLITKFINDSKSEVEAMHDWTALRTQLSLSTAASTATVTCTGAGNLSRIISVYDATNNNALSSVSYRWMREQQNYSTPQTGTPAYYSFAGEDSSQDVKMVLLPVPDAIYSLKVELVKPQADLAASATVITVPWLPVELLATAKALRERGEDNTEEQRMAIELIGRYILADITKQGDENDWYVN